MKIEELERRIKELEDRELQDYPAMRSGMAKMQFEEGCLHNGCRHEINPACNLYCPHCSPRC